MKGGAGALGREDRSLGCPMSLSSVDVQVAVVQGVGAGLCSCTGSVHCMGTFAPHATGLCPLRSSVLGPHEACRAAWGKDTLHLVLVLLGLVCMSADVCSFPQ